MTELCPGTKPFLGDVDAANLIDPATGQRPLGSFFPSEIDTKANEGMSIFHALQLNVTRRFYNGFFVAGALVSGSMILKDSPILYFSHMAWPSASGKAP